MGPLGELGALFNPGMRHEMEERRSKAMRREEEGNARDGDLRIDLESGVAVINSPGGRDAAADDQHRSAAGMDTGADTTDPAAALPPSASSADTAGELQAPEEVESGSATARSGTDRSPGSAAQRPNAAPADRRSAAAQRREQRAASRDPQQRRAVPEPATSTGRPSTKAGRGR
ncbi:DUF6191 domain-containing protein [Nakamurella endophytica]|uniref:Uncharacterized protein n=1 Tax=Nakamurella endophytica TaxID=1748367 RepID=A0A917SS19_9ACTN|nr:DUF6191 domain-containing protein [Nakamurella endophytica]GGL95854.1 hypothetical protein GCM10011594_14440 [Nakamurella endophytica]